MNNEGKRVEAQDFNPIIKDYSSKKCKKTSIGLSPEVIGELNRLKAMENVNISQFINRILKEYFQAEKALAGNVYGKLQHDYIKVELVLHADVAIALKLIEALKGAIPLANKLAEVLALDPTNDLLRGDCSIYGASNRLDVDILPKFARAVERLKDTEN